MFVFIQSSINELSFMEKPTTPVCDDYEKLPTSHIGAHMIAGAASGILEHCVMYPVDSVKVDKFYRRCVNY